LITSKLKKNRNSKYLIMDILGNCVFGLSMNSQQNHKNKFFQAIDDFISSISGLPGFWRLMSNLKYSYSIK